MDEIRTSAELKKYIQWPLLPGLVWIFLIIFLYAKVGGGAALAGVVFFALYVLGEVLVIRYLDRGIRADLMAFAAQYGQVQGHLMEQFVLPYALLDEKGAILWMNGAFRELTDKKQSYHKNIAAIFPELTPKMLPGKSERTECTVKKGERLYRAAMKKVLIDDLMGASEAGKMDAALNTMTAVYLFDETEHMQLLEQRDKNKLVCGLLSLDNYEEAVEGVEELRRSLVLALVERKLNKYFTEADGILRKTEKDKYFFLIRKKALEDLEMSKFSILEDVKTVNVGNEMSITLSIGIGLGEDTLAANADAARWAHDLALGRGGDQVVVREGYTTRYFGGKTETVEKYTRVKARVKAQALKEIITSKDAVFVMGHKNPDADALGAAVGIYRAAKTIDRQAHIVVDNPPDAVMPLIESFRSNPEYGERMFISARDAKDLVNNNMAVVVVDTNRPNNTECEELLGLTNTVIVLDHHRQGKDIIGNAVLSYIEPYASSACEMVSEVLQYFDDKLRLRPLEADSLFAGIMIDTNNFLTRTGVRTFEAAAYLRRNGADVTRIRKMFRESLADRRARAQCIADAELFNDSFAISVCPSASLKSPTVVCAQAANDLLSVVGVKASFVLTMYNGVIYISARAIDEVNVQLIMERLGGGGHLNIAGAQLYDTTMEDAIALLKETISEMQKEGDI